MLRKPKPDPHKKSAFRAVFAVRKALSLGMFCLFSPAQIGFLDALAAQQLLTRTGERHHAGFQHVAVVRHVQRRVGVLLDQQNGDALLRSWRLMMPKISLTTSGARPSEGSSIIIRRWTGHHGPAHGQHLLLTAGKRTCQLPAALLQGAGKACKRIRCPFESERYPCADTRRSSGFQGR